MGGARLLVQLTTGLVAATILYGCGVNCEAEKTKLLQNVKTVAQVEADCCVQDCDTSQPKVGLACICKNKNWADFSVQAKKVRDNCADNSREETSYNVIVALFDLRTQQCSTQAEQTTSVQVTGMPLTMAVASQGGGKLQKTSADVLLDADQTEKELITQV